MIYLVVLSLIFTAAILWREREHKAERNFLLDRFELERKAERERREAERQAQADREATAREAQEERHQIRERDLLNRIQVPQAAPFMQTEMETGVLSVDPNDDEDYWKAYEERQALSG